MAVRDSASGLDRESAGHVFDTFYTTKSEGMGMGLAISRSIVEAHAGRLWATANQPRALCFSSRCRLRMTGCIRSGPATRALGRSGLDGAPIDLVARMLEAKPMRGS